MSILINSDDINAAIKKAQTIPFPANDKGEYYYSLGVSEVRRHISECPDSTPAPPPKYSGKWLNVEYVTRTKKVNKKYVCDRCGWSTNSQLRFCGKCGSRNIPTEGILKEGEYEIESAHRFSEEFSEE